MEPIVLFIYITLPLFIIAFSIQALTKAVKNKNNGKV